MVSLQVRMVRASTTYYLVTTTRDAGATGSISIRADGPIGTGTDSTGKNDITIEVIEQ